MWEEVYIAAKNGLEDAIKTVDSVEHDLSRPVPIYESIGGKKSIEVAVNQMSINFEDQKNLVKIISGAFGGPKI